MNENVYNALIKVCDELIDKCVRQLTNINFNDIWDIYPDDNGIIEVVISLRCIMTIKRKIENLHSYDLLKGGQNNERSDS